MKLIFAFLLTALVSHSSAFIFPKPKPLVMPGPDAKILGCFNDNLLSRAISGQMTEYNPNEAVKKCYERAKKIKATIFAVQFDKQCFTSENADSTYNKYGKALLGGCANGRGGFILNDVYEITYPRTKPTGLNVNTISGGGWQLVRHVPPQGKWFRARDQLRGTEVYGTPCGPLCDTEFSVKFDNKKFDQFLFISGDQKKWLIADKDQVMGYYSNADRNIYKSSIAPKGGKAKWYRRQGNAEDPWISLTDHHDAKNGDNIIYGEASFAAKHAELLLKKHWGANVYIRKQIAKCPDAGHQYPGDDLGKDLTTNSWQACSHKCNKEAKCKVFTWTVSSKRCSLKSTIKERRANNNKISGAKGCLGPIPTTKPPPPPTTKAPVCVKDGKTYANGAKFLDKSKGLERCANCNCNNGRSMCIPVCPPVAMPECLPGSKHIEKKIPKADGCFCTEHSCSAVVRPPTPPPPPPTRPRPPSRPPTRPPGPRTRPSGPRTRPHRPSKKGLLYKDWKNQGCDNFDLPRGCYDTRVPFKRGKLLVYWRHDIEWNRIDKFARSLKCACAEAARRAGARFFGLHFWGECWALDPREIKMAPQGDCTLADGLYKTKCPRANGNKVCLGIKSYYTYKLAM